MRDFDAAVEKLGIILPAAPRPVAAYVPFVRYGELVMVSGQLPSRDGKVIYAGRVPDVVSVADAQAAARMAAVNALAVLKQACGGTLNAVQRILRLGVFVQSADGFDQQPAVANGASTLMEEIFGEAGRHARAAVGVNALPLHATVEVELWAACV